MLFIKPHRPIDYILQIIRVSIFSICAFVAFSGHYPPSLAQRTHYELATVPVITTTDSTQNDHIDAINKHLQATDDNVKALQVLTTQIATDNAVRNGQVNVLIGILGLLAAGGFVIQIIRR